MPKVQTNLGPLDVTEPVKRVMEHFGATLEIEPPQWGGPFPVPHIQHFTWLILPGEARISLFCLEFSFRRNEPSQWSGMVSMMVYTARALVGLPPVSFPPVRFDFEVS